MSIAFGALQGEMMYDEFATLDMWLRRNWAQELSVAVAGSGLPPTDETVWIDLVTNWDTKWHPTPVQLRLLVIAAMDAKRERQTHTELLEGILYELKVLNLANRSHAKAGI